MRRLTHLARLARDLWTYTWRARAWWLIPVVTVLGLLAALVVMAANASVFIYTLF